MSAFGNFIKRLLYGVSAAATIALVGFLFSINAHGAPLSFGKNSLKVGQYNITVSYNSNYSGRELYVKANGQAKRLVYSSQGLMDGVVSDGVSLYFVDCTYSGIQSASSATCYKYTLANGTTQKEFVRTSYTYLVGAGGKCFYYQREGSAGKETLYRYNVSNHKDITVAKNSSYIFYNGQYLYCEEYHSDVQPASLYIMALNGKQKAVIDTKTRGASLRGNYIYYFKQVLSGRWQYVRCNLKGGAKKTLASFDAYLPCRSTAKYVYYVRLVQGSYRYYRMNESGGNVVRATEKAAWG